MNTECHTRVTISCDCGCGRAVSVIIEENAGAGTALLEMVGEAAVRGLVARLKWRSVITPNGIAMFAPKCSTVAR